MKYLKRKIAYLLIVVFLLTPLYMIHVNAMEISEQENIADKLLEEINENEEKVIASESGEEDQVVDYNQIEEKRSTSEQISTDINLEQENTEQENREQENLDQENLEQENTEQENLDQENLEHLEENQVQLDGVPANTADDFDIQNGVLRAYTGSSSNVVIPSSVTYIGEYAFYYNTSITTITIPSSVTGIGRYAFELCTNLDSVYLSEGLNEISAKAFHLCTSLNHITIPSSVIYIGAQAFAGCNGLAVNGMVIVNDVLYDYVGNASSLNIIYGVKTIGERAFEDCTSPINILLPSSVTKIEDCAFYRCTNLESISIPIGVTNIGAFAFYECISLETITIPNTVTQIKNSTFYKCSSLTSVTLPISVTSIGETAFYNCSNLDTFSQFASVTSIGSNAFYGCTKLADSQGFLIINHVLYLYNGANNSVTIPSNVYEIGSSVFANRTMLTDVSIPNSVTKIGYRAFYKCSGLTTITIPNTVTTMGNDVFAECTNLASITLSNQITSLGWNTFYNCTSLTNISLPDHLTIIGKFAFLNCSNLLSITFPNDSIQSIEQGAFANCTGLTNITLPSGIQSLGEECFAYCTNLASVTLPDTITNMGMSTFAGCTLLSNINIPTSLTRIENHVFDECSSLTNILVPEGINEIGEYSFYHCGLTDIIIPSSATLIEDRAFEQCAQLERVTILSSSTNIYQGALDDCSSNLTFFCYKNSNAHSFAINEGIRVNLFVESVSLSNSMINLLKGKMQTLSTTVLPFEAANKNVSWTTSNPSVITVDTTGKVTAVAEGSATITVTTMEGNKTASCTIVVVERVNSVRLNQSENSLVTNQVATLIASILPANAGNKNVTWTSTNPNVATVDSTGKITAVAEGTAVITVTTVDGNRTVNCTIHVTQAINKIRLNTLKVTLAKKASIKLEAAINPENAANKSVTWSSSDPNVANVDNTGKVTAKAAGNAIITVAATDGSNTSSICMVEVLSNKSYKVKYNLNKGKNAVLNPTYYAQGVRFKLEKPSRKGYEFVGWYLDNKKINSFSKSMKGKTTLDAKWNKVSVNKTNMKSVANKKQGQISISFDKVSGVKGYTVFYSTNKKLNNATKVDLNSRKKSASITNLEKDTTYYVTVKGYKFDSQGNRIYGKSNKIFKIKILK